MITTKIKRDHSNRKQGNKELGDKKRFKTSITVPPSLWKKIKDESKKTGDSRSDTCCRYMDIGYSESQKTLKN